MKERTLSDKEVLVKGAVEDYLEKKGYLVVDVVVSMGENFNISLFLYHREHLDIDHLTDINRDIQPMITQALGGREDYFLEVSSPGIYRKIKTVKEFDIFKGKEIKIVNAMGEVTTGQSLGVKDRDLLIKEKSGNEITIDIDTIKKASLNG